MILNAGISRSKINLLGKRMTEEIIGDRGSYWWAPVPGRVNYGSVVLTFESANEILRRDHSNETSFCVCMVPCYHLSISYKKKFGIFLKVWFLAQHVWSSATRIQYRNKKQYPVDIAIPNRKNLFRQTICNSQNELSKKLPTKISWRWILQRNSFLLSVTVTSLDTRLPRSVLQFTDCLSHDHIHSIYIYIVVGRMAGIYNRVITAGSARKSLQHSLETHLK